VHQSGLIRSSGREIRQSVRGLGGLGTKRTCWVDATRVGMLSEYFYSLSRPFASPRRPGSCSKRFFHSVEFESFRAESESNSGQVTDREAQRGMAHWHAFKLLLGYRCFSKNVKVWQFIALHQALHTEANDRKWTRSKGSHKINHVRDYRVTCCALTHFFSSAAPRAASPIHHCTSRSLIRSMVGSLVTSTSPDTWGKKRST
jgi:hypothetical protein